MNGPDQEVQLGVVTDNLHTVRALLRAVFGLADDHRARLAQAVERKTGRPLYGPGGLLKGRTRLSDEDTLLAVMERQVVKQLARECRNLECIAARPVADVTERVPAVAPEDAAWLRRQLEGLGNDRDVSRVAGVLTPNDEPARVTPSTMTRCTICDDGGPELTCERCGARLHDRCYWKTRPAEEERSYDESPIEEPYEFICQGCRV